MCEVRNMVVIGWMFAIIGIVSLCSAIFVFCVYRANEVRFPRWIRVSYLIMIGVLDLSFSGLFFGETLIGDIVTYLRICACIFAAVAHIIAAHMCIFKIVFGGNEFVYKTLFIKEVYAYDNISEVNAEIGNGINSLMLTVNGRKITLTKMMQGYGIFLDKLTDEQVFVRCPII